MAPAGKTAIATWFVADKVGEETHFPQMEGVSSSALFQINYWRCIVCFFDSSLRKNADADHVLFTNAHIPVVDGVDLASLFQSWKVQVIQLPISHRLPRQSIKEWGNQFYILDIIKYVAAKKIWNKLIVLDCDCIWRKSADSMLDAIDRHGCLTYTLSDRDYAWDASINGATRQEMALALQKWTADCGIHADSGIRDVPFIHYHGGEIFAATQTICCELADLIDSLWKWRVGIGSSVGGVMEEAHFLSILYALCSYPNFTANAFLKRIWTTFHLNNANETDLGLMIWHLPAEKRRGFRRMFHKLIKADRGVWTSQSSSEYDKMLADVFGIPRRSATKFIRDFSLKLLDEARRRISF